MSEAFLLENGHLCRFHVQALPEHIDRNGHVNNKVYMAWAEQAAGHHWRLHAPPAVRDEVLWVASRIEIDFKGETLLGEELVVTTRVGRAQGARFERLVEVDTLDGRARTRIRMVWAMLDLASRRPRRVLPDLVAHFGGRMEAF